MQPESTHEAFIRWLLGSGCLAGYACNSNLPGLGSSAGFPGHRAAPFQSVCGAGFSREQNGRQAVGAGVALLAHGQFAFNAGTGAVRVCVCARTLHRLNYSVKY